MHWSVGRVRNGFIGILCTAPTRWDVRDCKDAILQPRRVDPKVHIPRRICDAKQHSWIVIVGTIGQYSSLTAFIERLQKVVISEEIGSMYEVIVQDGDTRIEYSMDNISALSAAVGGKRRASKRGY
jgi:hypothetical protein